jgi:hypothetical protein
MSDLIKKKLSANTRKRKRTIGLCLHHAAFVYSPGTAVTSIINYHMKTLGWSAPGYAYVIQKDSSGKKSEIVQTAGDYQLTHGVYYRNDDLLHFCIADDLSSVTTLPDVYRDTLLELMRHLRSIFPDYELTPFTYHSKEALKSYPSSCPGQLWLNDFRNFIDIVDNNLEIPDTVKLDNLRTYTATRRIPVTEGWNKNSKVAANGTLYLQPGDDVVVDEEYQGRYHLLNGSGFVDGEHLEEKDELDSTKVELLKSTKILEPIWFTSEGDISKEIDAIKLTLKKRKVDKKYIPEIAYAYAFCGKVTGIGTVVPMAQAMLETGNFKSKRWIENYNPAGLGATDDGATGAVFSSIFEGVLSQYGHLLLYAAQPGELNTIQKAISTVSPRYDALRKYYGFGSAVTWSGLTGKWATDGDYFNKIKRIVEAIL